MAYPLWLARLLVRTGIARWIPAVNRLTDGGVQFLHYYSDRVLMSPNQELREVLPLLSARGTDLVDLSLGAPRFDLLPAGTTTKLPVDQRGYPPPQGLPELREAVAQKLHDENGVSVASGEEVLITAGAGAALSLALDTFLSPGERVVLFDPCYMMYQPAIRNRRGRITWLPTRTERGGIRFALDGLARALRRAQMIVVNSPANPTGGAIAPEDLEQIAWWADRHDVLIFSDEVYERYQYDGPFVSIGSLPKARARTLTANSLSKSHALAAYRVGWLAGHRHLLRPCAMTALCQSAFVPTVCQQLALSALRLPAEAFLPVRKDFQSRRLYVHERLQAIGFQPSWPAGGFFFWVPVKSFGMTGQAFAERLLREKRVLVLPGDLSGPSGKQMIRISYAGDDGRLREGLNRLADFVRALAPAATGAPPAVAA